mmetsp:Transcript_20112/g.28913  ORF Transcript_20112/g.28913 Transcript_20112/m.28913 type:complete len:583 (+) Transcript_20112:66-1814(+)
MSSLSSSSTFIDQNLAAQLFVAAHAHDSLQQDCHDLLPSTVTDVFPVPVNRSRTHRTSTYSALAKSQQPNVVPSVPEPPPQPTNHEGPSITDSKLVILSKEEPRILKYIASFLDMNDKQSLMFAVTEDDSGMYERDEVAPTDQIHGKVAKTAAGLAEDVFKREKEDLESARSKFLTQLARTREAESRMEDLQQQLDRTRCMLENPDSGDLLLLNYMASRLHLLRELTSRNYDDFFSARAQYSAWCRGLQNMYKEHATRCLEEIKATRQSSRAMQEESLLKCRTFLREITSCDIGAGITSDSAGGRGSTRGPRTKRRLSLSQTLPTVHSGFYAPTSLSFDELWERGDEIISAKQAEKAVSHTPVKNVGEISEVEEPPFANVQETKTAAVTPTIESTTARGINSERISGPSLEVQMTRDRPVLSTRVLSTRKPPRALRQKVRTKDGVLSCDAPAFSRDSFDKVPPIHGSLDGLRKDIAERLQEFEKEVCDKMEKISELSMMAIRKKFVGMNETEEVPDYVKDIKWRMEQWRALVTSGSEHAENVKGNIADEFEERIRTSYSWLMEQQMKRLRRMQHYCQGMSST